MLHTISPTPFRAFAANKDLGGGRAPVETGYGYTEPFKDADLIIDNQGGIYHLGIRPEQIASKVIAVGDPERVLALARDFNLEVKDPENDGLVGDHRGLKTFTGWTENGNRISLVTHAMGVGSTEIVIREIMQLWEIDFSTRCYKPQKDIVPGTIIRLGTSGALQKDTELGTAIITDFACTMSSDVCFSGASRIMHDDRYLTSVEFRKDLFHLLNQDTYETSPIPVGVFPLNLDIINRLKNSAEKVSSPFKIGHTMTAPGFNASQGRPAPKGHIAMIDKLEILLATVKDSACGRIENFEMEIGTIAHLLEGSPHQCGAVCATVAHRPTNRFAEDIPAAVSNAALIALHAIDN